MISRRALIAGGAGTTLLAALGYRAWDRGVFSAGKGPAFAPWDEWQGQAGDGARRPLHAAILAANAHDTQPWLFAPSEDSITVYADRARNLGSFDPFRREMHLSLGCAIENLQLMALKLGLTAQCISTKGRLQLSPTDAAVEVAKITLWPLRDIHYSLEDDIRLADTIPRRHTNRGPYRPDQLILPTVLDDLAELFSSGPARIVLLQDTGARRELGDIIVDATRRIISDKAMSEDSARWFRTGRHEVLGHRDGVTTDTAGLSPFMSVAAKMLPDMDAKSADDFWLAATRDIHVPTATVLGLVMVQDRLDMTQAIAAGQAWQRLHLKATVHGIAAQPMNQPVEMVDRDAMLGRPDTFKAALQKLAGLKDAEATFVFRLGYAERPALPSPRRPLDDVIRKTGLA